MTEVAGARELSKEALLDAYRTMRTIREFEERLHTEFATGEIPGFVHLYAGEEAIAAGVMAHLDDDDYVASTHRGHGHSIAKGCDVKGMMFEIYGKDEGICRGKGGSMHIADLDKGMLGANGIVGGGPPLVCGVGLSAKIRGTKQVGVSFTGDGGANQGTFLESLNLASVWDLPVVFIMENNGYAEATAQQFSSKGIDIAKRADGFSMPGVVVDGHDFFAVYEAAGEAIKRAREGGGPSLIEAKVNRYYGHFEGDAQTYRAENEVEEVKKEKDCLMLFRQRVTSADLVEEEELDKIDEEIKTLVDESVEEAKAAPEPDPRQAAHRRIRLLLERVRARIMAEVPRTAGPTMAPYFGYRDAAAALQWLAAAFGFEKTQEFSAPDGTVMIGTGQPPASGEVEIKETSPTGHGIYVVVDDVDAHYEREVRRRTHRLCAGGHGVRDAKVSRPGPRRVRVELRALQTFDLIPATFRPRGATSGTHHQLYAGDQRGSVAGDGAGRDRRGLWRG